MAENKKKSVWEAYRFSIILVGAILVGSLIGIKMGTKAVMFKPLGDLFINGMFMVVVPLVLYSLVVGAAGIEDITKLGRVGIKTLVFYLGTTAAAVTLALIGGNIINPGLGVRVSDIAAGSVFFLEIQ